MRSYYDHIGLAAAGNAVWFLLGFLPVLVFAYIGGASYPMFFLILGAILTFFSLTFSTVGNYYIMNRIVQEERVEFADFFRGARLLYLRCLLVVILNLAILVLLLVNALLSFSIASPIFQAIGYFWLYLVVCQAVVAQYVFPVLVSHDAGVIEVMKRAVFAVVDDVFKVLFVSLFNISLLGLFISFPMLLPFFFVFFMSFVALVQGFAYEQVKRKSLQ